MGCWDRGGGEEGPLVADRVVEVLREGVVDDANLRDAVYCEAEGDADVGVGVHEVGRPIYRIDYETWT